MVHLFVYISHPSSHIYRPNPGYMSTYLLLTCPIVSQGLKVRKGREMGAVLRFFELYTFFPSFAEAAGLHQLVFSRSLISSLPNVAFVSASSDGFCYSIFRNLRVPFDSLVLIYYLFAYLFIYFSSFVHTHTYIHRYIPPCPLFFGQERKISEIFSAAEHPARSSIHHSPRPRFALAPRGGNGGGGGADADADADAVASQRRLGLMSEMGCGGLGVRRQRKRWKNCLARAP